MTAGPTEEDWIAFLKRTTAYHCNYIALLSEGSLTVAAMRDGVLVDTTAEALAQHRQLLAEAEDLVSRWLPNRVAVELVSGSPQAP